MKLSHASGYALAALAYIARAKPDGPVASHVIAAAAGLPERYLLKVLKPLVDAGVLRSLKGPHGGYRLARPPKAITLLEVVEAADGPVRGDAPPVGRQITRLGSVGYRQLTPKIAQLYLKHVNNSI